MDMLTSINVFRQVVESGSFVGAADHLDVSTAMVSKHVTSIEKHLRVRLLNRSSRKLALTEAGKLYLERCKGILEDLRQTELELESMSGAARGTLRIAFCDTCIPGPRLAPVLTEYRRRCPDVVLDLSFVDRVVDLAEEGYDLALRIVSEERLPTDVVARRITPIAFRLAASRAYLERHGIPKGPEDLARHDFIARGGLDSLSLEGPKGRVEVALRVALRCRTMADVAITVAGGLGIALLPEALLNDPAFVGELRPVLTEFRLQEFNLYLLYPERKFLPFKARAFIDLLTESGPGGRNSPQPQSRMVAARRRVAVEERLAAAAG